MMRPSHHRAYEELVLKTSSSDSAKVVMLKAEAREVVAPGAPRGCARQLRVYLCVCLLVYVHVCAYF